MYKRDGKKKLNIVKNIKIPDYYVKTASHTDDTRIDLKCKPVNDDRHEFTDTVIWYKYTPASTTAVSPVFSREIPTILSNSFGIILYYSKSHENWTTTTTTKRKPRRPSFFLSLNE